MKARYVIPIIALLAGVAGASGWEWINGAKILPLTLPLSSSSTAAVAGCSDADCALSATAAKAHTLSNTSGQITFHDNGDATITTTIAGRLLQTTVLATGTSSFTTRADTGSIHVRMIGPGGGGGSAQANAAGNGSIGGGGGAGAYCEFTASATASNTYTVSLPSGGAGGANTGANNGGVASGDATFVVGATTYTATKGLGGIALGTQAGAGNSLGGGSVVATNCDINGGGAPGGSANMFGAGGGGQSGIGGSSIYGAGGGARKTNSDGINGNGCGAGGSGALSGSGNGGQAGGNGAGACAIVDEYSLAASS